MIHMVSLEAECLHKIGDIPAMNASFQQIDNCLNSYSIILSVTSTDCPRARLRLVELLKRQPSAYSWMALADNWLQVCKLYCTKKNRNRSAIDGDCMDEPLSLQVEQF